MPVQFDSKTDVSKTLKGLELSQLLIVHRHGERTPVASVQFPFSPPHYNICSFTNTPLPHQLNFITTNQLLLSKCYNGQLTDQGKINMRQLGLNLRAHYPHLTSIKCSDVKVRSTGYNRTVESVRFLLNGMLTCEVDIKMKPGIGGVHDTMNEPINIFSTPNSLPKSLFSTNRVAIHINHLTNETMLQGSKCQHLESLIKNWKAALTQPSTTSPLQNLANGHSAYDAAVCARDNFGVVVEELEELEDACVRRWWDMYSLPQVSRLAMGRFVGEVAEEMESGTKLAVFSGHDSTVAPFLGAFGVYDKKFPPFGSIVGIEVWKETEKPSSKFVRMHYNGKKMFIPFCSKEGNHLKGDKSVCTYDAFMRCVSEIVPKEYDLECSTLPTLAM